MKIARFKNINNTIPPEGYGGTQRVMAQVTALEACTKGDEVLLYASADSRIIEYTRNIAEKMGLRFELYNEGASIRVENTDGSWGSVTLRTAGDNHTDDLLPTKKVLDLLIEDEKHNPSDIVHLHDRRFEGYLQHAGITNVVTSEHTERRTFQDIESKPFLSLPPEMRWKMGADGELGTIFPLIAISHAHYDILSEIPGVNMLGVASHGIHAAEWPFNEESSGYLLSINRFTEDKGTARAIKAAAAANMPLILAGGTMMGSEEYYEREMKPYIHVFDETLPDLIKDKSPAEVRVIIQQIETDYKADHSEYEGPLVIMVGEVSDEQKKPLYANADATLMLISLQESLGLVMIESMATGTPVIACSQIGNCKTGSVEEVVDHGKTGFKVTGQNEQEVISAAAGAIKRLPELSRGEVRRRFDERWSGQAEVEALDGLFKEFLRQRAEEKPGPVTQPAIHLERPAQREHTL